MNKNALVTNRDLDIFRFLFESKVATSQQISDKIFPGRHITAATRRLRKLSNLSLIRRKPINLRNRSITSYSLSEQGFSKYLAKTLPELSRKQLRSDSIEHDIVLCEIRSLFESYAKVTSFHTENMLQSLTDYSKSSKFSPFIDRNSDAVIELESTDSNMIIPIEYEASLKANSRIFQVIYDYYANDKILLTLYICKNDSIMKKLISIEEKVAPEKLRKVYFASLDAIEGTKGYAVFSSSTGKKIRIK